MTRVDFHTHSTASPDGGIKPEQYRRALESGLLDVIAITDHNRIDQALELHENYPEKIIVGEEIMTSEGELIGLFLKELVLPGQSAVATVRAIREQGGVVYAPHPLETLRKGLSREVLDKLAHEIDIVEVCNGRALFQNRGPAATTWARLHHVAVAASSDAHGNKGLGTTYTQLSEIPTTKNLVALLKAGRLVTARPPLRSLLYPKLNRLKKRRQHS